MRVSIEGSRAVTARRVSSVRFYSLAGAMSAAAAFRSIEPEEKLLARDARGISCRSSCTIPFRWLPSRAATGGEDSSAAEGRSEA